MERPNRSCELLALGSTVNMNTGGRGIEETHSHELRLGLQTQISTSLFLVQVQKREEGYSKEPEKSVCDLNNEIFLLLIFFLKPLPFLIKCQKKI